MDKDIQWFIGFIGVFVIIWIAGGGVNSERTKKPFIEPLTEGGEIYGKDPLSGISRDNTSTGTKTAAPSTESLTKDIATAQKEAEKIQQELEDLKKYSPLRNKITLRKGNISSKSTPSTEQLVIYAASSNSSPITLSGLVIKSTVSQNSVTIGNGATLVMPGSASANEQISLPPGGIAYVTTGRSPIGPSFRINSCTGYFEQNMNFTPTLPVQCPKIIDEPLPQWPNQLSDKCLDYMERIPRCTITSLPSYLDQSCTSFIAQANTYNQCVAKHRNDEGFFGNQWRVYLGKDNTLWKSTRENIVLLDTDGKVISEISY